MNLVQKFDDSRPKHLKSYRPDNVFLKMVNKISKIGHSDLFLIRNTPLPQDELGIKI